jgi:hypothetical protein
MSVPVVGDACTRFLQLLRTRADFEVDHRIPVEDILYIDLSECRKVSSDWLLRALNETHHEKC